MWASAAVLAIIFLVFDKPDTAKGLMVVSAMIFVGTMIVTAIVG